MPEFEEFIANALNVGNSNLEVEVSIRNWFGDKNRERFRPFDLVD